MQGIAERVLKLVRAERGADSAEEERGGRRGRRMSLARLAARACRQADAGAGRDGLSPRAIA